MSWIVGIDEAGRGPLAGPVAVGAVLVPCDFDWAQLPEVGDSKKMTEKARERMYAAALSLQEAGALRVAVRFSSAQYIDVYGIVPAVMRALAECLEVLQPDPAQSRVLLDGGLRAPEQFTRQDTIIRGDASEPSIGLASIMAKVARDHLMLQLAAAHPVYGFERHKGYGTAAHLAAIAQHGISPAHRRTFIHLRSG